MNFIESRQIDDPYKEYWPLNPAGPLPAILADRQQLCEAFFTSFPASRRISSSAVRRALKHTAKKLGIASGRVSAAEDLQARDEALAFKFASLPVGRDALPQVEVHVEDSRRRHGRNGQLIRKFEEGLPEILWSRIAADSQYAELVKWTQDIAIERPDLGKPNAHYITANCLDKALLKGFPPLDLNDPELARTILIFAALLPPDEAMALVRSAGRLGIDRFRNIDNAETADNAKEDRPEVKTRTIEIVAPPTFERQIPYEEKSSASPSQSPAAASIVRELKHAQDTALQSFEYAIEISPARPADLIIIAEADFDGVFAAIQTARSSRQVWALAEEKARAFIRSRLEEAFARTRILLSAGALAHRQEADALVEGVNFADAIFQLSFAGGDLEVDELWQPRLLEGCRLDQVHEAFKQLPSIRDFLDNRKAQIAEYISRVRKYLVAEAGSSAIANWISRLSGFEITVLSGEIEAVEWPVIKAILTRLAVDRSPEWARSLEDIICGRDDPELRRDLFHFLDPDAVLFDDYPKLQRVIIAERLHDILTFGPIETISDPSLRLGSAEIAGAPVSDLMNWLVQHLDLFGNGSELRELAAFKSLKAEALPRPAVDLLAFALTPSNSAGFYLLLREAIRERYFLPLVRDGKIDTASASSLAAEFVVDDAIERAALDVRKTSNRAARIEARHRARIHGYVRSGKDLLDAFVRSSKPAKSGRDSTFTSQLQRLLGQLNTNPAPVGSKEWLERRVAELISGQCHAPDLPTLKGEAGLLDQQVWTADDTAWAQQSIDLPEFYLLGHLSPIDVAAAALRQWNVGRQLSPSEMLDGLIGRGLFSEALSFVEEAIPDAADRSSMKARILKQATSAITPAIERFRDLRTRYEEDLFQPLATTGAVSAAISRYDVRQADEQLDLLELELQEAIELRRLNALDASKATEKSILLGRLLEAGVEGLDEKWLYADLQKKWAETVGFHAELSRFFHREVSHL